jgi:hypothetical protein
MPSHYPYLAPVYSNIKAIGSSERLQVLDRQEQVEEHHAA